MYTTRQTQVLVIALRRRMEQLAPLAKIEARKLLASNQKRLIVKISEWKNFDFSISLKVATYFTTTDPQLTRHLLFFPQILFEKMMPLPDDPLRLTPTSASRLQWL